MKGSNTKHNKSFGVMEGLALMITVMAGVLGLMYLLCHLPKTW